MNIKREIVEKVLARTCVKVVFTRLNSDGEVRQTLRLKNFGLGVFQEFINDFQRQRDAGSAHGIELRIPFDAELDCKDDYRIPEHSTITFARNDQELRKLIYLETAEGSDAQSTKDFFTIRDSDLLTDSINVEGLNVVESLIDHSTDEAGSMSPATGILADEINLILRHFRHEKIVVSTSNFVAFVYACASDLVKSASPMDVFSIRELIGRNLFHADLFGDEFWAAKENQIGPRLKNNRLARDLAKSDTQELDVDKIIEHAARVVFTDEDGTEYEDADQIYWRDLCISYLSAPTFSHRSKIPFFIFNQLFKQKITGIKLGEQVRLEIEIADSTRIPEFLSLNVEEGLNANQPDAAQDFLDAEPDNIDQSLLKDLLESRTRKRIERLLTPKAQIFFNPLLQISKTLAMLVADGGTQSDVELKISLHEESYRTSPVLGMFNFMFGRLLVDLANHSATVNSLVTLTVSDELAVQHEFPEKPEDSDDEDWALEWSPLVFRFELFSGPEDDRQPLRTEYFSWLPDAEDRQYLFLWWGLVKCQKFRDSLLHLQFPEDLDHEKFRESCLVGLRLPSEVTGEKLVSGSICPNEISEFEDERKSFLEDLATNGIHHDQLSGYVDYVRGKANSIRASCVPKDKWLEEPYQLLASDQITTADHSACFVLPSNAVKARWISEYLKNSFDTTKSSLNLEIPLNSENSDLYFSWIEDHSGSQQPATTVDSKGFLFESFAQRGWGEVMIPVNQNSDHGLVNVETPDAILEEITAKVRQYLNHHPHKIDGLNLTLVTRLDAAFASRLVAKVRQKEFAALCITVNLVTRSENFSRAMKEFDGIDVENRFALEGALFPPVELRLFEFEQSTAKLKDHLKTLNTDIAIIPQLLEGGDEYLRGRVPEDDSEISGTTFKPLIDNPVFIQEGSGAGISVSLKPEKNDLLSDSWSTLVTRQKDSKPVSNDGTGTDYYEKKIAFAKHAELFESLHAEAHWVITAERYLKREQLELLQSKPEIISFREGVGPGGNYSIIVSSDSGRHFVLSRLQKKLKSIFNDSGRSTGRALPDVASGIYESAREITPELALDALGVSRISEEILGLAVARQVVDQLPQGNPVDGFTAWISLDANKHWFAGGESSTRADMVKLTFDTAGERLRVGLTVLESKLRKDPSHVEHADVQVQSTLRLINQIVAPEYALINLDGEMWRSNLLGAIRNSGLRSLKRFGKEQGTNKSIELSVGDAFVDGDFELSWLNGLTVQSVTSGDISSSIEVSSINEKICRVKVGISGILKAFEGEFPLDDTVISQLPETMWCAGRSKNSRPSDPDLPVLPTPVDEEESVCTPEESGPPSDTTNPDPQRGNEVISPVATFGKYSEDELKHRYQNLLNILTAQLKLPVRAVEWDKAALVEGPSSFLYKIRYDGATPREVEAKHDALKLKLGLDEDQSINFSIGGGVINIDVPKNDDERYFVTTEDLWDSYAPDSVNLSVPLGIDRYGDPVIVNFSDSDSPHLLVGGTTGSGKSEALHTILCGFYKYYSRDQIELLLVDPKGTEMEMYRDTAFVNEPIAMFDEEALELLKKAVDEMQNRFVKFKALTQEKGFRIPDLAKYNEISAEKLPWMVLVIDEYADITSEKQFKKDFEVEVRRIAQKGRSAGVHLIIATQKPSAEVISTVLRSNLPAQIALRVKTHNDSSIIIEETGAEGLIGKGDAIFKSQKSTRRVQCGRVDDIGKVINA